MIPSGPEIQKVVFQTLKYQTILLHYLQVLEKAMNSCLECELILLYNGKIVTNAHPM